MPLTPSLRSPQGEYCLSLVVLFLYGVTVFGMALVGIQQKYNKKKYISFTCGLGLILVLVSFAGDDILSVEKIHYVQYMLVYAMSLRLFKPHTSGREIFAFVLTLGIGIMDETVQIFIPLRVFDVKDILINMRGAVLGLFARLIYKYDR